ncbi:MAG TPA: LytTR family DNA-binding domain-containing protein [Chitinophagaceae bacterium]|jgi:DNA-binding LytR/AlgR family response regulator|nr:LytTR family DNA-binding domain-containing protein [Chitinophagaceae bacterium]
MKKLKCVIVDDEPVARKILQEFSEQVPYLDIAGKFENALKADAFLQNNRVDIMFLDIEMPRLTGLQYLKATSVQPLVILTTAFPQYALEGYELDIIDYLLKPFAFSRFLKAVQKARDYYDMKNAPLPASTSAYIFVRSDKRIEKVELADILYTESMGNYVSICTEHKKILAYLTLKSIESQLPGTDFIKIHQSFIVNLSKINAIEGNQVMLKNTSLPISRNYRDNVMQVIEQRLLKR